MLKQINHPHPYYFREMYLPQLTTGPGSVAWSPDSKAVVYSMAGSLWQQNVQSDSAIQLTVGPGYDYQPDWSHDGRWIVYARYDRDMVALWALDTVTMQGKRLTTGHTVNVEPRLSPDGTRIAFVSTSYNGRFHIFTADFRSGTLENVQRLTGENRSTCRATTTALLIMRSAPPGRRTAKELLFVSNRGHIYGTGGFWRMKAEPGGDSYDAAREIHYEETNWKSRPEFSPDGKRIVYASYLGQSWHQLWTMPAQGGDPFPLSYGDFDNVNPRWSPDGKHIAFISNRSGNISLWMEDVPGGAQWQLIPKTATISGQPPNFPITVSDTAGNTTAARIFVTAEDGLAYAPDDAWMHADDSFDRHERRLKPTTFTLPGRIKLEHPAGP